MIEGVAATPVGLLVAAAAGFLSFLSPCVLPLLPGYLAYLSGLVVSDRDASPRERRLRALSAAAAFAAGLGFVFVVLGLTASAVGLWLSEWRVVLSRLAGVVVIVLGLQALGVLRVARLSREFRPALASLGGGHRRGVGGAAFMGAAFGLGWTPCVGPMLGGILLLASQAASAVEGSALLVAYAAGFGVPFIVAALAVDRIVRALGGVRRHGVRVERVAGLLLLAMGAFLVTDNLGALGRWTPFGS